MKKLSLGIAAVLLIALGAFVWSFTPEKLPVGQPFTVQVPQAHPPAGMSLVAIEAGKMISSAAFAYRGGSLFDERVFNMGGILVRHPKGNFLFDTGFGRDVDAHFKTIPWLMRLTSRYEKETPVADQLKAAGIPLSSLTGIILTHAHWDHVSGIPDLPGVPVWVNVNEQAFINSEYSETALIRSLGKLPYHEYFYTSGPYLGFDKSLDVLGDGSIVLVPAPGHTPGSIIAFIATPDGKRYALVGDLVWQKEGIDLPAERPWISRELVDWDADSEREIIVHMHKLQTAMPNLIIVPAHDRQVWNSLPKLTLTVK
ncbi:MAG: MBL fold metallo-hydrolase [Stenotrophobium sp.]